MEDKELTVEKAIRLYRRYCTRSGFRQQEPGDVEVTRRRVRVTNVNGVLATFVRLPQGRLRLVQT